jgi:DNA-binding SARP family transcriptional activator
LLLVVLAPPAMLLSLVGSPLELPAGLAGTSALSRALDDTSLLWLLALGVWLTWLHLLACLTAEAVRLGRGRAVRIPMPRLLFGANALLASHLIATLLLPAAVDSGLTPAVVRTSYTTSHTAADAPAEQAMSVAPPGVERHAASAVTPHRAAADELPECRVLPPHGRHHDTLWDIAERHLGDGTRWREIYALNEHRLMADGHRLTRASLIRPGWILRLPTDARRLDIDHVPAAPVVEARGPAPHPEVELRPEPPDSAPALAGDVVDGPDRETRRYEVTPTEPQGVSNRTDPGRASHNAATAAPENDDQIQRAVVSTSLGTLALSSLALLTALTRRRKVAARRRPIGIRTTPPAAELVSAEARLRRRARRAQDISDTLRLALLVTAEQPPVVVIRAVWEHPDGSIELILGEQAPAPAPFTASDRGWVLSPQGQRYLFAVRRDGGRRQDRTARLGEQLETTSDPCPLLLPVGEHDGSACLVNLEPLGLISLQADNPGDDSTPDRPSGSPVHEIVTAWARGLAGAPWTEQARVYLPEDWREIALGHDRLLTLSLSDQAAPRPLSLPDRHALQQADTLDAARRTDAGPARLLQPSLLLGHRLDQIPADLLQAARDPLDPIVVLLTDPHPGAEIWRLGSDGTLSIPGIADRLVAQRLDSDELALHVRLLEHAQDPPLAVPQAATVPDEPADTASGPERDAAEPTAPVVDASDVRPDVPPVIPETRTVIGSGSVARSDLARDADGARPVEVAILGPLVVSNAAGPQLPRQQALEMLVYLSLHRQPITLERLSAAIWPDRTYNARTVQNRLGDLRRYLGDGLVEKLPGNRYRLADLVVTDWQRFIHLADGNHEQQLAALSLVRGAPFAQAHLDWYHLDGQLSEMEAAIVDLSVTVGQRVLKTGDYDTARTAARAGLRGCPYDERLYRLGMQAAAAQGATSEVRQLRNQLAWILEEEIEPDDTVQPATEALYDELREHDELTRYRENRRA